MGVLGDGSAWCFCGGRGKAERIKSGILAGKGAAVAAVSSAGALGTGFLIHRNLLLTTHANIPSAAAAAAASDVRLSHGRLAAQLVPQRFFITSPILDLSLIGIDPEYQGSQGHQSHFLKPCLSPNIELGSTVFLLGHTNDKELSVGEGKVVIATDNLIKFSADGFTWRPGSAGFDTNGNLAFIVCDPMKIAPSSPTPRYASAVSTSLLEPKKDVAMQFGIPIPVILDWLHQHWNGNLEDVSKPKLVNPAANGSGHLSLNRLCSVKSVDQEIESTSKHRWLQRSASRGNPMACDESVLSEQRSSYERSNSTSGIYGSLISTDQFQKNDHLPLVMHISTPPMPQGPNVISLPLKQVLNGGANIEASSSGISPNRKTVASPNIQKAGLQCKNEVFQGTAYHNYSYSEVNSSSSPPALSDFGDNKEDCSSGDETMFSAETRESRNVPSPQEKKLQPAGRGKGGVSQRRWSAYGTLETPKGVLVAQPSSVPMRKANRNAVSLPQKAHDYFSPTVSSSMKKRNSPQQPTKPRQSIQLPLKRAV